MKSKTEILNLLRQYKPKAQREYGLTWLFGCKVDMVRLRDNMNSLLRQRILKDGIYV